MDKENLISPLVLETDFLECLSDLGEIDPPEFLGDYVNIAFRELCSRQVRATTVCYRKLPTVAFWKGKE